jgi:RNA polymerase sigma-70 factor (subfamily 1)
MSIDDSALLRAAAAGDDTALRALLEQHGQTVWREIHHDIGTRYRALLDADDVMQVTYMEAFLQIERLTATDAVGFIAWLRRIAQNNLRDAIKELERKKRPSPAQQVHAPAGGDSCVALVELLGETSGTPSRHFAAREAGAIINTTLDRMPPDYARVIRLYDLENVDIAEVAARMERSPGAVHMLRARAHDHLRDLLGAETDFFSHPA